MNDKGVLSAARNGRQSLGGTHVFRPASFPATSRVLARRPAPFGAGRGGFDDASDRTLEDIYTNSVPLSYLRGQRFIDVGDSDEYIFVVTHGTAKVFKSLPNGRQQIIGFVGSGDFVGLAVVSIYNYSVEAVDTVRLSRVRRTTVETMVATVPAVERRLFELTAQELALAQQQILLLGRMTACERLAAFLANRARTTCRCPSRTGKTDPVHVALPMSRGEIADFVGLRVETVSRALTLLRTMGFIDSVSASGVVIRDLEALEGLALAP